MLPKEEEAVSSFTMMRNKNKIEWCRGEGAAFKLTNHNILKRTTTVWNDKRRSSDVHHAAHFLSHTIVNLVIILHWNILPPFYTLSSHHLRDGENYARAVFVPYQL